jgi:hypothetical protein
MYKYDLRTQFRYFIWNNWKLFRNNDKQSSVQTLNCQNIAKLFFAFLPIHFLQGIRRFLKNLLSSFNFKYVRQIYEENKTNLT